MAKARKSAKKSLGRKAMKKTRGGVSLNFAKIEVERRAVGCPAK